MKRGPRLAACAALAAASALAAGRAEAVANVSLGQPSRSTDVPDRTSNTEFYISYADCQGKVEFTFPVMLAAGKSGTVWISETDDCKTSAARLPTGACRKVGDFATSQDVVLDAATIAGVLDGVDAKCNDTTGSSTARALTIYFLSNVEGDVTADDSAEWTNTKVDLLGPEAPSGVTLGVGNQQIILKLPTANADTSSYIFFCDPPTLKYDGGIVSTAGPSTCDAGADGGSSSSSSSSSSGTGGGGAGGTGGTGGAAGGSDAGTDAGKGGAGGAGGAGGTAGSGGSGGGSAGVCADQNASIPGLQVGCAPHDVSHVCATAESGATEVTLSGLANGTTYTVAIAAVDDVGNVGPLSPVLCETPWETDEFFHNYCANGGLACMGCGFCSIGGDVELSGPALAWGGLVIAGFAVRRASRRRRDRRRARRDGDGAGPREVA